MSQTKDEIRSYVKAKFIDSSVNSYIKSRIKPETTPKYYEEEIDFWVEQIFNSKWTKQLFLTEFNKVYKNNFNQSLSNSPSFNDYIGQTFKIEASVYPKGMFLSSLTIFTALEDDKESVILDVRPVVNGIPAAEKDVIPGSVVTCKPDIHRTLGQEVLWDPTQTELAKDCERLFKFDYPIYLAPGYYCFTLKTNSSNYSVYISENNKGTLGGGKTVVNPYIGDYIYSGQGESWIIDPTKDLCFCLIQAEFSVGTKNLYLTTKKKNFDYDLLHLNLKSQQFNELAYIDNCTAIVTEIGTLNQNSLEILPNSNITPPSPSTADVDDGVKFTISLKNVDKNLTPIIDTHKVGVAVMKYYVNRYSKEVSDSELNASPAEQLSLAKYTTKAVTLNENFDADGITAYIDVNKPAGTQIEVFYRILNKYDTTVSFNDSKWYRLPQNTTATPATLSSDYVEETYQQLNIEYIGEGNGVVYNSFNQLAVKVVFYSDDSTKVPKIKNLRVIATV